MTCASVEGALASFKRYAWNECNWISLISGPVCKIFSIWPVIQLPLILKVHAPHLFLFVIAKLSYICYAYVIANNENLLEKKKSQIMNNCMRKKIIVNIMLVHAKQKTATHVPCGCRLRVSPSLAELYYSWIYIFTIIVSL